MRITLQIENVDRLETGGQVSYSCADRGFDIGRHEHLDWSLPDPQRVISGKHCEVRFENGQFVLYDVSTNGTFLNGSPNRMDRAHVLRSGDRLMIGDYIISVALEAEETAGAAMSQPESQREYSQPWESPASARDTPPAPAWPSAPGSVQQAPYPVQDQGGPWAPPSGGMEGRHAPPSSAPGIGTPADDVWSQQGHGWGNADPALYDPNALQPEREPARPAQADPLDHLASQPDLARAPVQPVAPEPMSPAPEKPLFAMPDLDVPDQPPSPTPAPTSAPPPAQTAAPAPGPNPPVQSGGGTAEHSPFPETAAWGEPVAATPAVEDAGAGFAGDIPEASDGVVPVIEPTAATPPSAPETAQPAVPAKTPEETTHAVVGGTNFIKAFAEGAGIPPGVLEGRDPEEFARELGGILQGITGDLMGLLQARSQVKAMTRNANRTLISRSGNNALKFSPTPQMALQTMLSQNAEESGYLPIDKAMTAAFKDIQKHHVWTYAAMQKAAARFDETLSPKAIEAEGQVAKSTFGNPKAKFWERLQERWTSLSGAYDDGLVGVFTQYFTESYEELSGADPEQNAGRFD